MKNLKRMLTRLKLLAQNHTTLEEKIRDWHMSPPKHFTKLSNIFGDVDISREYSPLNVLGETSLSFEQYWHMLITGSSKIYNVTEIRKEILRLRGKTLYSKFLYGGHGEILCYLADNWNGEIYDNHIIISEELLPLHFKNLLN